MRVRFFGRPWPNPERRAPVCADDRFAVPVELVAGHKCIHCNGPITAKDRGVITACSPGVWGHFRLLLKLVSDNFYDEPWFEQGWFPVCAYHLTCWMESVVGGEMSADVVARMHLRPGDVELSTAEIDAMEAERPLEDAEPGKGWRDG